MAGLSVCRDMLENRRDHHHMGDYGSPQRPLPHPEFLSEFSAFLLFLDCVDASVFLPTLQSCSLFCLIPLTYLGLSFLCLLWFIPLESLGVQLLYRL